MRDVLHSSISYEELLVILAKIFISAGTSPTVGSILAENCASSERDGATSHGIFRVKGYLSSLKSGWADGQAEPIVEDVAPGFLRVNAANGFAQPALQAARASLLSKVKKAGIACVAIRNSHHFGALWPDLEPLAVDGFVCLTLVNSGSRIVPFGGHSKVYGTNPLAFGFPRRDAPPLIFDQASSSMAFGDVRIAARRGDSLAPGAGVDRDGNPTSDPRAIVNGGALLPFGGHKGSSIAMMVEVMAAALTGGNFSYQCSDPAGTGETANAGQFLMLIDPECGATTDFQSRIEDLLSYLVAAGQERFPGDRRYATREQSLRDGIRLAEEDRQYLSDLLLEINTDS